GGGGSGRLLQVGPPWTGVGFDPGAAQFASDLNEVVGRADRGEALRDLVDGVALGDAGEVELDPAELLDGPGAAVEAQPAPAAEHPGGGDLVLERDGVALAEGAERARPGRAEAPQVDQ